MRPFSSQPMPLVTLGEGNTPLIPSTSAASLYFKLECCNPTGSYKDRFAVAEVHRILEHRRRACISTSSGNTGSALAACCARYGLRCIVVVNPNAPAGKLMQMRAYGATVIGLSGFAISPEITQNALEELARFSRLQDIPLVISAYRFSPVGMSAVEQVSQELAAQLPGLDHVFVPVGSGGLFAAIVRGFAGHARIPRIHAVQPEGCPTLLNAFRTGIDAIDPVSSTTQISGLSVPFDIDAALALQLLRSNGGQAVGVTDRQVLDAQVVLLQKEGVYAEPAGAAALAGYKKAVERGFVGRSEKSVCIVTGHGFKDPASVATIVAESDAATVTLDQLTSELSRILEAPAR